MTRHYTILHFWPASGGFGKRMEMLEDTLRRAGTVRRLGRLSDVFGWLRGDELRGRADAAVIYTSLLAPLALFLRILRPGCPVYYMVRGDEVTYTAFAGRRLRSLVALVFQKALAMAGCRFVFASADLRSVFVRRLGRIRHARLLPNTLGRPLPPSRPFDGRVALVGNFGTVKNIEHALASLDGAGYHVDLYGNRSLPEAWRRPWLHAHGHVEDLVEYLRGSSLVVLAGLSEGFPNVLVEAVEAGCGVVAHAEFPFRRLPLAPAWRFDLSAKDAARSLRAVLDRLRAEQRNFKQDNPRLVALLESDWSGRVLKIFAPADAAALVRTQQQESPRCESHSA